MWYLGELVSVDVASGLVIPAAIAALPSAVTSRSARLGHNPGVGISVGRLVGWSADFYAIPPRGV